MVKMNPEVKEQWVAALRSGKYKQGYQSLRPTKNKFCCLGVLCDLHSKEFDMEWEVDNFVKDFIYEKQVFGLPQKVKRWAKLGVMNTIGKLIEMNDGKNESFRYIADWIEENL